MLYDFQSFLEELDSTVRGTNLKKNYAEAYSSFPETLEECAFFEYLNGFIEIAYRIPEEMSDSFDWGLLLKLASASFSSEYAFSIENDDDTLELVITVTSGETTVTKKVSELFSFQIARLIEIYFYEQFDLQLLTLEEGELEPITSQRNSKLEESKAKQFDAFNQQISKRHFSALDELLK
jgi:hypothetical protein